VCLMVGAALCCRGVELARVLVLSFGVERMVVGVSHGGCCSVLPWCRAGACLCVVWLWVCPMVGAALCCRGVKLARVFVLSFGVERVFVR